MALPVKPYLPNTKSKHRTSLTMLFDMHWAKLGVHRRWTPERFVRLANFHNWTPYELASFVGMPHSEIERFLDRGGRIVGPAAIWLTRVEHDSMGTLTHETVNAASPQKPS
jgi:hypothetical protein